MPDRPIVIFKDNVDRFGPEYTIHFNPGRLLEGPQVPAYQQYVMRLARDLEALRLPEVLSVWGWCDFLGVMEQIT